MRKIYVVSKYAGNVKENTKKARMYCRYVIARGEMPVASHLLYPQFLNDGDANERDLGCTFGLMLLDTCDEVWVFGDECSKGMQIEIDYARHIGKPIHKVSDYFVEQTLNISKDLADNKPNKKTS